MKISLINVGRMTVVQEYIRKMSFVSHFCRSINCLHKKKALGHYWMASFVECQQKMFFEVLEKY